MRKCNQYSFMKILYVSTLCSKRFINDLYRKTSVNPGFAVQKFNRLVAEGFAKNGLSVTTLSAVPAIKGISNSFLCTFPKEYCKGIAYRYLPYCSISFLRRLIIIVSSFFRTLRWGIGHRSSKVIVYDVLNVSVCIGSLLASKVLGIQSCGIVTDMPGLMVNETKEGHVKTKIIAGFNRWYLRFFNYYVFLTEAMNAVINRNHRPYIVMEGLVDSDQISIPYVFHGLRNESIVYAGGLYEEYGLKLLIDAFLRIKDKSVYLDLFGSGPLSDWINDVAKKNPRVRHHGVVANDEIVRFEQEALLLVNPRPTAEEFTKYSFPSKNMEYMLSGTATLTTNLPGMPYEYHDYVLIFKDESIEGYTKTLDAVLDLGETRLCEIGEKAREWVMGNKNNVVQAGRIIKMIIN